MQPGRRLAPSSFGDVSERRLNGPLSNPRGALSYEDLKAFYQTNAERVLKLQGSGYFFMEGATTGR
jgi:hypothetical protein